MTSSLFMCMRRDDKGERAVERSVCVLGGGGGRVAANSSRDPEHRGREGEMVKERGIKKEQ